MRYIAFKFLPLILWLRLLLFSYSLCSSIAVVKDHLRNLGNNHIVRTIKYQHLNQEPLNTPSNKTKHWDCSYFSSLFSRGKYDGRAEFHKYIREFHMDKSSEILNKCLKHQLPKNTRKAVWFILLEINLLKKVILSRTITA